MTPRRPAAVLFDLDGTIIDSAPDLAGTANDMREARGLPSLPFATLRPRVGSGARGMVGVAFGVVPGDETFDALKREFLERYAARSLSSTGVFEAMKPVLDELESHGIPWGVVTNKHERFAGPIVAGLGLDRRASVVVCGDTTPHAKPHPAPLLEAARRMGVDAGRCVYIGDDHRDMEAAAAAGMRGAAAAWGYFDAGEDLRAWGGEVTLAAPGEILNWLGLA